MGLLGKFLAGLLGLASFGLGLWPVGILFFLYMIISFRPGGSRKSGGKPRDKIPGSWRHVIGLILLALSAVAFASGGSFSPIAFLILGVLVLSWPEVGPALPFREVVPISNSILLRSKYFPLAWHAISELKPGPEPFPRALSSVTGRLVVFAHTGKIYLLASCFALGRKEAETGLLSHFRASVLCARGGAYLLPLDADMAADVFRLKLSRLRPASVDIVQTSALVSGVLSLDCLNGSVNGAQVYEIDGPARPARIPPRGRELESPPLLWELLDSVGKRTKWPDPDTVSGLLDSLTVTRGVALAERFRTLEGSGNSVTVQSLAGEEVHISRTQLRAMVFIYS
jgi:hypothetical protein